MAFCETPPRCRKIFFRRHMDNIDGCSTSRNIQLSSQSSAAND